MNKIMLKRIGVLLLLIPIIISFWLFSRFTVDDAFISWRYGNNLINSGIWAYNPSLFDLTQAYTNPIYVVFSIVPNILGIDVVLFFKLISILTFFLYLFWYIKKIGSSWNLMLLFFLALPATCIHLFSGLETFLFAALMTALLISLYEENLVNAIGIGLVLLFVRPEAWLFSILIPIFFLIKTPTTYNKNFSFFEYINDIKFNVHDCMIALCTLCLPLVLYFVIHVYWFGSFLPNTFYIKTLNHTHLSLVAILKSTVSFSFYLLPLLFILLNRSYKLFIFSYLFFGLLILNYSISDLAMNYAGRFSFHIFAPVYLFMIYFISKQSSVIFYTSNNQNNYNQFIFSLQSIVNISLLSILLFFARGTMSPSELLSIYDYYPRAIDSHAALGKYIHSISNRYNIKSFSFGDAGMTAYQSSIVALDNIGLASSAVARNGINDKLLNKYALDLIVFHARPDSIRLKDHQQQIIYNWGIKNGFRMIGDIYWRPDYTIRIYSKIKYPELEAICNSSYQKNNIDSKSYFINTILQPPWYYWKE